MKKASIVLTILVGLILGSCSFFNETEPIRRENFLTLADVTGTTSLKEDSPDVRIINVKAKALIKKDDIRNAKNKALEIAEKMAVESMVRELMDAESYNKNYEKIETYLSKNVGNYVVDREVIGEKKIYADQYYGIAAAFKVSRQKVLVALQKDLRLIDASRSTLITVVTSKKDLDLSSIGLKFSDIEDALMNQIQTDLNQRGLTAMDFRNAITAMQTDNKKKELFGKISKEQFMSMVAGSKPEDVSINENLQKAESKYATGLTLLKLLAKVVIEVNILSVSKTGDSMVLNLGVTAKNISVGTGGAFANTIVQVARKAGPNTDDSAMITALIKDAYGDMNKEFIPQVLKEMSTIDVGGDKLIRYELVMKGFDERDFRKIRTEISNSQTDQLRYIDFDNTLKIAQPPINIVFVRFAGKTSELGDKVLQILDKAGILADEPMVAPDLTDLVFVKSEEK